MLLPWMIAHRSPLIMALTLCSSILVKNLVGYIRRNVCVPLPRVSTIEELNGKLLEQCPKYQKHHVDGKPASAGEILTEERLELHAIPRYTLDTSKKFYQTVR